MSRQPPRREVTIYQSLNRACPCNWFWCCTHPVPCKSSSPCWLHNRLDPYKSSSRHNSVSLPCFWLVPSGCLGVWAPRRPPPLCQIQIRLEPRQSVSFERIWSSVDPPFELSVYACRKRYGRQLGVRLPHRRAFDSRSRTNHNTLSFDKPTEILFRLGTICQWRGLWVS